MKTMVKSSAVAIDHQAGRETITTLQQVREGKKLSGGEQLLSDGNVNHHHGTSGTIADLFPRHEVLCKLSRRF